MLSLRVCVCKQRTCIKFHIQMYLWILACLHADMQGELAGIAAKLRAYRPAATVLEAEVAPARTGDGGTGASGRGGPQMFLEVMRLKRSTHDGTIQARSGLSCLHAPASVLPLCGGVLFLWYLANLSASAALSYEPVRHQSLLRCRLQSAMP